VEVTCRLIGLLVGLLIAFGTASASTSTQPGGPGPQPPWKPQAQGLWIDPRDYGAACNSRSHDDGPAIGLSAAAAVGLPIVLPAPLCTIETTVQVQYNGTTFFSFGGNGPYNNELVTTPYIYIPWSGTLTNSMAFDTQGRDGVTFRNISFIGANKQSGYVAVGTSSGICCGLPQAFAHFENVSCSGLGNCVGSPMSQGFTTTIASGTYNSGTGAVSLTTTAPHGLGPGSSFNIPDITGTGVAYLLAHDQTATPGTTGNTLNFTAATGLTLTITGGDIGYGCDPTSGTLLQLTIDGINVSDNCSGVAGNLSDVTIKKFYMGSLSGPAIWTPPGSGALIKISDGRVEYFGNGGFGAGFGNKNEGSGIILSGVLNILSDIDFDHGNGPCIWWGDAAGDGSQDKSTNIHCNNSGWGTANYYIQNVTGLEAENMGSTDYSPITPVNVVRFYGSSASSYIVWHAMQGAQSWSNRSGPYFGFDVPLNPAYYDLEVLNAIHQVSDSVAPLQVSNVQGSARSTASATDTLAATDCGTTVIYTGSSPVVTIPASIVPAVGLSCQIDILQSGSTKVSVNGSAVTPATLISASGYTGTNGTAGSKISLQLTTVGVTAEAILTGLGS